MPKVTYDGEDVKFEGGPPKNLGHLIDLLRNNAASAGRVLTQVIVDGKDALTHPVDLASSSYTQVEAHTTAEKEMFLKAVDMTLQHLPEADAGLDPILQSLLSDSWQTAFGKLNELLQNMTGFFELLANLAHYAERHNVSWKAELSQSLREVEKILTKVLKLCEKQQVADLVSALNVELRPIYSQTLSLVKNNVRPTFVK